MDKKTDAKVFVLMGVAGSGKSSVGEALAKLIKAKFIDGDDLHPKQNVLKMSSGQHLTDDDRNPWLERICDAIFSLGKKNETAIVVCSALKKRYRQKICEGNDNVIFLFLYGDFELVLQRMQERKGHYMPVDLLKSQFDALEVPLADEKNIITIQINGSFEEVVERCVKATQER